MPLPGLHRNQDDPSAPPEPMVHVDLDHPRISETEGEPVFLRHGGNSPYLEQAGRMLRIIYEGAEFAKPMFAAFEALELIEPMDVEVNLSERVKYRLPDFFTLNQERLGALGGEELERLNRHGYLQLAMLIVSSLGLSCPRRSTSKATRSRSSSSGVVSDVKLSSRSPSR